MVRRFVLRLLAPGFASVALGSVVSVRGSTGTGVVHVDADLAIVFGVAFVFAAFTFVATGASLTNSILRAGFIFVSQVGRSPQPGLPTRDDTHEPWKMGDSKRSSKRLGS